MNWQLSDVAYAATVASIAIAILMLLVLAWLIARRFHAEARAAAQRSAERDIAREMLAAISAGDPDPARSPLHDVPADAEIAATTHLFQLLRGTDRDRLIARAEASGVFSGALRDLSSRSASRRVDAIRMLERFGTDASVAALRARMAIDPSPAVRIEAAATLAQLGRLPSADDVIAALGLHAVPLTRQHLALLRAMAPRHHAQFRAMLREAPPVALRAAIVEALGWSEDFATLPEIARHACAPEAAVRSAALNAAGHLGHPGARGWIVDALDDDSADVRAAAIAACDRLDLALSLPQIAAMRADPEWIVRVRARRLMERAARAASASGVRGA